MTPQLIDARIHLFPANTRLFLGKWHLSFPSSFSSRHPYAAVGHGGGSGYLATMSLLGISPDIMKPTARALNILVASIGTWKYSRADYFSGRLFWPIAAMSVPFAFIGGRFDIPTAIYRPVVGHVLLYAAFRLWLSARRNERKIRQTTLPL